MTHDERVLFAGMRAFDAMYGKVEARLRDAAIRMLGDACEVVEFMEDCRAFLLVSALSFDPKRAKFADWAERMTVNACRKRRRILDKELSLEGIGDKEDKRDPIAQVEARIDCERAIAKLPPMQRVCFRRHVVEGYSYSEIGGELGIEPNAAKANVHLAKQKLIIDVRG